MKIPQNLAEILTQLRSTRYLTMLVSNCVLASRSVSEGLKILRFLNLLLLVYKWQQRACFWEGNFKNSQSATLDECSCDNVGCKRRRTWNNDFLGRAFNNFLTIKTHMAISLLFSLLQCHFEKLLYDHQNVILHEASLKEIIKRNFLTKEHYL